MTHILHRAANAVMLVAVSGSGVEIVDAEGKRYLNASGGAAVSCLGHGHPEVIAALRRQLDRLPYAHTAFFTTEPAERLADRLVEKGLAGFDHVYLVSGGSEAIEAALKMARQYFVEIGQPERRAIVARRQSYHGATLGALAAGGAAWRRARFEQLLIDTHHIDPCCAYVCRAMARATPITLPAPRRRWRTSSSRSVQTGSSPLWRKRLSAPPPAPCRGSATISSASGRSATATACCSSSMRSCAAWDVPEPCTLASRRALPRMTVAKGLGGGYQPVGAVLLTKRIFRAFAEGSGSFHHGHTYMGHPMAAARRSRCRT
jgi:adenosylmethionine-8-amino-7-oxononanoate aminotransferase